MVEIVIFALLAGFLGLRLYSVLGKRTGHEQPLVRAPDDVLRPAAPVVIENPRDLAPAELELDVDPSVEGGLRAISVADRTFNAADFIDGAKRAYRMILEGYWSGDAATFADYVADDVGAAFNEAIAARKELGQVLDNRLITIERTVISAASLVDGVAHIMVRFDADIAAVTRDTEGRVIAGSLSDAVPTHDSWTFSRTIKDKNPNWILTDTDEAE
ncbi:MAG: Tim44/TimA family putative adaptor protein [Sphingomonadaceae bacterium]